MTLRSLALTALHHWCKWRYGFASFGAGSVIKPLPRAIFGARNISIGKNCFFGEHLTLGAVEEFNGERYAPRITIGDNCAFGAGNLFSATASITIEHDVMTSIGVFIGDSYHGYEDPDLPVTRQPMRGHAPIVIGAGTFLGIHSAILPGVRLGEHCYVGANAVVTKSFEPYTVIVGNPARALRRYDPDAKRWVAVGRS